MSQHPHQRRRGPLVWDDGSASERTVLAWERTAIASIAVAAIVLRAGIVDRLLGIAIPAAALLLIAAAGEWLFSRRVWQDHNRPYWRGAVVHGRAILVLVGVSVVVAAVSAVLAVGS